MRALIVSRFGGPEVLEWQHRPAPEPAAGEIAVQVGAVGLAWTDLVQMAGLYAGGGPEPPYVPGWEFAGRVVATANDVEAPARGSRVFGFLPEPGALAEIITLPAAMVDVTPAAVADVDAASMVVSFLTADAAAVTVGRLEKGEAVLVTAAAGGVGSAAVQLCRLYGAGTIVAAAGTEERRRYAAELGADVVCGYDDILESARAATDGRGVDLVIESVGGTAFDQSFEALTTSGRVISLGISGGERPAKLRLPFLWHRGVSVGGVHLQRLLLERPDLLAHSRRRVWDALERGHVKACVWKSFAPDDVAAAYDALRTRQVLGRAVIDFSV